MLDMSGNQGRAPGTVRAACWLMAAGAGGTLVLAVLRLITGVEFLRELAAVSGPDQGQAVSAMMMVLVERSVLSVIGIVIWLWMCWKNGQGRAWARNLTTVLAVLALAVSVPAYALLRDRLTFDATLSYAFTGVFAAVVLVLLWHTDSRQFISACRRREGPGAEESVGGDGPTELGWLSDDTNRMNRA